jgi:sirohydrochlorin cobaltochelatase
MKTSIPVLGIILFAHGSRDPLWSKPIEAIAHLVSQASPSITVRCAYLELMSPTLEVVVNDMVQSGIGRIRIVPMFLGVGKHAREDLPQIVRELQNAHPTIAIELMNSIGEHPDVMAAIAGVVTNSASTKNL